jgi:Mg-chelatase subunit ChlD
MTEARLVLLVLVAASGLGCADVDDATDAGVRGDGGGDSSDSRPANPYGCQVGESVQLAPQPPDVLILLDRSESMAMAFGSSTRYQAVAALLAELVGSYARRVRFGYQELPGQQGCAGPGMAACCVSPPTVGVSLAAEAAVASALASAWPVAGGTPTAAALQVARAYYDGLADGIDHRYVLLATDGTPNCTLAGTLAEGQTPDAPACADALAQVSALYAAGVRVIVLGVGLDLAGAAGEGAACLDSLAHAGGAAASPGSPGYYVAGDPEQLRRAIEQIFGGVARPSCVLYFSPPVLDPAGMAVFLDGQRIPQSSVNGWEPDDSEHPRWVRINGEYCDQIQSFEVTNVVARFKCPPTCVDITGC